MIFIIMETILNKIKTFLKWLVVSNLGRILLAFLWTIFWLTIDKALWGNHGYNGWAQWVAFMGISYLGVLVLLAYIWVIDPIRIYKNRKKNKK